jgi:hypothetical protein
MLASNPLARTRTARAGIPLVEREPSATRTPDYNKLEEKTMGNVIGYDGFVYLWLGILALVFLGIVSLAHGPMVLLAIAPCLTLVIVGLILLSGLGRAAAAITSRLDKAERERTYDR